MKFSTDEVLGAGAVVLVVAFFLVLCYFELEDRRAKFLAEATARLIAAAPDLYETLCSMIHVLTEIATATKLDLEKTVIKAKDQATGKEASVSAMTVFIDALSVVSKISGETNE